MRRYEVETLLKLHGYKQNPDRPYSFYNYTTGHFASIGAPRMSNVDHDEHWSAYIWYRGQYNGESFYNKESLTKKLEEWPSFERVK